MNKIKRIKAAFASLFGIGAIMDSILEFSDAQAATTTVTAGICHVDSTNVIDLGDAYFAGIGKGTPIYLNVTVNTAFGGNATASMFYVWLQTSTNGSTWACGLRFIVANASNLATVGYSIVKAALPAHNLARYLQLVYESPKGMTDGYVDSWLSLEAPTSIGDTTTWGWTA